MAADCGYLEHLESPLQKNKLFYSNAGIRIKLQVTSYTFLSQYDAQKCVSMARNAKHNVKKYMYD